MPPHEHQTQARQPASPSATARLIIESALRSLSRACATPAHDALAHPGQTHTPGPRADSGGAHMSRRTAPNGQHKTLTRRRDSISAQPCECRDSICARPPIAGGPTILAVLARAFPATALPALPPPALAAARDRTRCARLFSPDAPGPVVVRALGRRPSACQRAGARARRTRQRGHVLLCPPAFEPSDRASQYSACFAALILCGIDHQGRPCARGRA